MNELQLNTVELLYLESEFLIRFLSNLVSFPVTNFEPSERNSRLSHKIQNIFSKMARANMRTDIWYLTYIWRLLVATIRT